MGSGGASFVANQLAWTDADSLSVDGSAQTEFATDYANIQVDVTASGNLFNNADLIGWILYTQTTEEGIRNWFGALTSKDAANWKINTAVVDLYLDNASADTATQGYAVVLMRDDAVYPQVVPTTGGGGIGMIQSGLVFVTETGVSGLTTAESNQLMGLPSATDVGGAVWDATKTGHETAGTFGEKVSKKLWNTTKLL